MLSDSEVLKNYCPLVKFIAELCGPSCEVLLHDISNPDHAVIAIENGFYSGRKIGAPLPDYAKKIIESNEYQYHDFLSNHAESGNGKNFISSTFFIKNSGRLIGMLCVNRDMSSIQELDGLLDRIKMAYNLNAVSRRRRDTLDVSVPQLLQDLVRSTIDESGVSRNV